MLKFTQKLKNQEVGLTPGKLNVVKCQLMVEVNFQRAKLNPRFDLHAFLDK